MGLTTVILEITNPEDKSKAIKGEFLVDSGAFYTVLPKRMVEKLGLKTDYNQKFSLADGSSVTRPISSAYINFEGRRAASPVILGKIGDSPLMGALTLENLGYILNPLNRTLHPAKLNL